MNNNHRGPLSNSSEAQASIRPGFIQSSSSLDWQNAPQPLFANNDPSLSIPSIVPRLGNSDSPSPTIPSLLSSSLSSNSSSVLLHSPPTTTVFAMSGYTQHQSILSTRSRSRSRDDDSTTWSPPVSPVMRRQNRSPKKKKYKSKEDIQKSICLDLAKEALKKNDAMVYLEGPIIYTCGECRTHLTSHDEIISKSFHGRHGRAYLFDQCVNIITGPAEDRPLITGLHSVCDIFCKRCNTLIGWTYARAYEPSQRYKEGKFIIEKINLHMEENDYYQVKCPAGERRDRWKMRSMSWCDDNHSLSSRLNQDDDASTVYEYRSRMRSSSSVSWASMPKSPVTNTRHHNVEPSHGLSWSPN
eukprot:155919_1